MRILTLGVLIVAAGTLAALPFRRYQPNTVAAGDPVQDEQSVGQAGLAWDRGSAGNHAPGWQSGPVWASGPTASILRTTTATPAGYAADTSAPPDSRTVPTAQTRPPLRLQRSINMPLTYEDLAVPIDPFNSGAKGIAVADNGSMSESFNATVDSYRQLVHQQRQAMELPPRTQSLAVAETSDAQTIERRRQYEQRSAVGPSILADVSPEPRQPASRPASDAALASVSLTPSADQTAPLAAAGPAIDDTAPSDDQRSGQRIKISEPRFSSAPVRRQRYWVRQPN